MNLSIFAPKLNSLLTLFSMKFHIIYHDAIILKSGLSHTVYMFLDFAYLDYQWVIDL